MTRGLIHDDVRRIADERPQSVAVVFGDERVSYGELEARSNRLARMLQTAGCREGDRVSLLLPKGPDAVIVMLGILKAGCAYVPLDSTGPVRRVAKIVTSCEPRVIVTNAAGLERVGSLRGTLNGSDLNVGLVGDHPDSATADGVDFTEVDIEQCSSEPIATELTPDSIAYVLFTSGSTGMPKGVPISHGSVVAFVDWARTYFEVGPDDRVSGHSPLHFDLSVYDVFGALRSGAELHIVKPELNLLPHKLAEFIRGRELTQWFSVPSILAYLAAHDAVRHGDFPKLERLHWCGEVFPTPALRYWMERLPHVRFTNLYGPTEATIASSYHQMSEVPATNDADVPIGVACPGEELVVLDDGHRAEPGVVGELHIGGVGLSPGYWRDTEKTKAAFVSDPANGSRTLYRTGDLAWVDDAGLFHFVGRADSQIKTRGYRVELGEVENAVHGLDSIGESAVVAIDSPNFDGKLICCAYVPGHPDQTPAEIRSELLAALPRYMLPSRWLAFDLLPRNANGKIDRRRLREMFEEAETGE